MRWRHRRGQVGRMPKPRYIDFIPPSKIVFIPRDHQGNDLSRGPPVTLMPDELEALRLVYLEDMTQEEAAQRMGVSRGTIWRLLESGRKKLISALVNLQPIEIETVKEEK
ncbi:DUF134 domain-containing protein [Desulfurococcaceae archaeon MEX13E-LK6-19]|nr:DUF134 domain-containing protein [Desulfurococcaceae archaeon MEX13E-LK6-19]